MSTPGAPPKNGAPRDDGADPRFQRGATSEAQARAYAETVSAPEPEADPGLRPEDPAQRAVRLRRRRRLLGFGALPAGTAVAVGVWMLVLTGLTWSGSHALTRQDHDRAVSRFETVVRLDPWLARWRVLYNLGTAELLAERGQDAVTHLGQALEVVPRARRTTDEEEGKQVADPASDECRVRRNLYAAYVTLPQQDPPSISAQEAEAKAVEALADCEPPAQDNTQQPSPPPSASASPEPPESASPSQSPTASADPSASSGPSASASPSPSPDASASPSSSPSPSPAPSEEPDPQASALASRNAAENDDDEDGGSQKRPGRRW